MTLLLSTYSFSKDQPSTLCNSDERTIFSCPFNSGRTVSICTDKKSFSNQRSIQYRYGKSKKNLELIYPRVSEDARKHFFFFPGEQYGSLEKGWIGGPSRILSFNIGAYEYSLEVFKNKGTKEYYGRLSVGQGDGESIAEHICPLDDAVDNFGDLETLDIPKKQN